MEHFLWVEKYRPTTIAQTILPERLKQQFQNFVNQKNVPNLLLSGPSGCGKTTVALAMLNELGATSMIINGSLEGNIDTLRNQIKEFASTVSMDGNRKYVILDEADYLTAATQPALRAFMEEFSKNCGFILTCNYKHKIIDAIGSRCSSIDFVFSKEEKQKLAVESYKSVQNILRVELVEYDKAVVAKVISKFFPDMRKILNELQKYSSSGKIDSGILTSFDSVQITRLVEYMKAKDLSAIRKWVAESEIDDSITFKQLYDLSANHFEATSIPQLILIIAKYMYQSAFVADKQINLVACLVEIVVECQFKA
jgi:DNA polymerase III delta prime subunit